MVAQLQLPAACASTQPAALGVVYRVAVDQHHRYQAGPVPASQQVATATCLARAVPHNATTMLAHCFPCTHTVWQSNEQHPVCKRKCLNRKQSALTAGS